VSKSVTYVGPYHGGVVVHPTEVGAGDELLVGPSETIDLPDDVAERLVEQGDFVHASRSGDGAPPHSALVAEWSAYRAAQGHNVTDLTKQQLIDLPDTPAEEG
jgi:hypothetical protein